MGKQQKGEVSLYLRVGWGGEIDPLFRRLADACTKQHLPFGVYWKSYALDCDEAYREAKHCVEMIEDYEITGPVGYEIGRECYRYAESRNNPLNEEKVSRFVDIFCDTLKRCGYVAEAKLFYLLQKKDGV